MSKCLHSIDLRCIEGTWVTVEIHEAIKQGYKIVDIYEVWHWENTEKYNPESKSGGIFTEYINMFLETKQEAGGYPDNVISDEEKEKYIKKYFDHEGIKLDKDKINYNKGLRSISKLMLNSLWGRFGMNTNKTQYKIISSALEWYEMITDDQYVIHDVDLSHPELIQVFYSLNENIHDGGIQTSVTLAAFVTAHARLKLYNELKKIGNSVLYFDTDSIIYISREGEYNPCIGEFLGEFTDEIKKSDADHIVEFISAGPKNYAFLLDNGKTNCTVKGFTLNYLSSLVINYNSIKEIVIEDRNKKIKTEQIKFSRDKKNWDIKTDIITKLYGFVYDKRVIKENYITYPYGF